MFGFANVCCAAFAALIGLTVLSMASAEPPAPAPQSPAPRAAAKAAHAEGRSDAEGMAAETMRREKRDPGRADRIKWWREARFGTFLCFSPAAQRGLGDDGWNIAWNRISWKDYEAMAREFQPSRFDPARIARQIKSSGARYVVFTAKHHAGFSMWGTKQTDFNIVATHGKDVLKGLCEALRGEGLRVGLYFSAWDWSRKEYRGVPKEAPNLGRQRGGVSAAEGNPLWPKFLDFYLAQAEELLSNYGKIDVLWIDAWKKHDPDKWASKRLWKLVRKKQPNLILNDRWADLERADFITAENHVPGKDIGRPWETCYRANGGWFYTKTPYRPPRDHIRMLIRCVSRNGNLLLNFPLSEKGTFDDEAVERMQEIGGWLKGKGDSIYGCGAAPLRATPWGSATYKKGHIYLHVFGELHSASAPIFVEGLESKVLSADVLGSGGKVRVRPEGPDVVLTLPKGHRIDPIATVIDLRVAEPVHVAARDFIRQWTVLTPLPGRSFHKPVGPEGRLDAAVPVKFGKKSYPWETVRAGAGGYVDLKAFSPKAYGTTVAATDVVCKRDFATQLLLSATANAAVYLNGTKVLSTRGATPPAPDADKVRITLPKGRSTLVVKSLGRSGPWGFYAWVAGGKQLRFEPTRSVAFVGADPASWQNAAAVIEADKARLLPGTDPLPGTPGLKGCRMRPREPAEATGFIATVNVAKKLENAYVLVRYGHIRDTEIAVAVAGRKPVKVKLPKTGGWRAYKTTLAPFGPLPAGEYPLHVYTTARTGAYHLEALVFAEGTPLGGSLRLQGRP